jgi:hypothetical protein
MMFIHRLQAKVSLVAFVAGILIAFAAGLLSPAKAQTAECLGLQNHKEVTIKAGERINSILVFNNNNQVVESNMCNLDDALLKGAPGTVVSLEAGQIVLNKGKIVVDSGNMPIMVKLANFQVYVEPDTLAVISYEPKVRLAIKPYASYGAACLEIAKAGKTISLNAGESFMATLNKGDKENISYATGGDLEQLAQLSVMRPQPRAKRLYSRFNEHLKRMDASLQDSVFDLRKKQVICTRKPIRILADRDSELLINEEGKITLPFGWVTVISDARCSIQADSSHIYLNKPAIVNIQSLPGMMRVATCHGINGVSLCLSGTRVNLHPGQELLVIDHMPKNSEVLAADGVMRRCSTVHCADKDKVVVASDFSIISLLYNADHLSAFRSAKCLDDKETRSKLVKTSAAVQYATAGRGRYLHPITDNHKLSYL